MNKKRIIIVSVCAVVAVGLIYNIYSCNTRNAVEQLIKDKKMINVLVAGGNRYHDNKHRFFSIVSVNPINNKIGITFVPPSYRIKMGGDDFEKLENIDFIYFDRIRNTFREDLKMNVPFYMKLYGDDVVRIVNLLEGIDLFVLDQVKDNPKLEFGVNYFDGDRIIKYINSAPDNSIYIKYDRVSDILFSLYEKKEHYRNLFNSDFIEEMFKTVRTNLLPQELYELGRIAYQDGGLMATLLPGGFDKDLYITDDISYRIYEKEFLQSIILDKKTDPTIKVRLLNGTNVPGLARKMRNLLMRDGVNVLEFGTSPYEQQDYSMIINRRGNYEAVKKISEITGINHIYHIIDNTELNNVLIVIGKDYISDQQPEKK
jgi:polyisoprenyl-teichoic acid--peptidoglycan teichoic acid transferase